MGLLRVILPGMLSTVQDLGRPGLGAIGIARGGAADALSLRIGNRLVGNPDQAAAIEMTMLGGSFVFEDDTSIALVGGSIAATIQGASAARECPMTCVLPVRAGERLTTGPIVRGVRTYLCVAGGIEATDVLGSASTHLGAGFGGLEGRPLRSGDVLSFGGAAARVSRQAVCPEASQIVERTLTRRVLRAVEGAHAASFHPGAINDFWSCSFTVSTRADRVGVRLIGQLPVEPIGREGPDRSPRSDDADRRPSGRVDLPMPPAGSMPSEGMMCGAVQLPPGGEPIVLLVDHPTTGGYPVIACVATIDIPTLAQLRPGESIRFERTTPALARELFHQRERELNREAIAP